MKALNNIRAALESRLIAAAGLPPIALPNIPYNPITGSSFIKANFIPVLKRRAAIGPLPQQRYDGLYHLLICTPEKEGMGLAYSYAETVMELFEATTDISFENPATNFTRVTIDYSETGLSYSDPPYYCTPVTIGWYNYSP